MRFRLILIEAQMREVYCFLFLISAFRIGMVSMRAKSS